MSNNIEQFFTNAIEKIGNYVPTIIGAVLVLALGLLGAFLLKGVVSAGLKKIGVDKKIENKTDKTSYLEGFISRLVFYIALVYVLILTLGVLGIEGVLDPINVMFTRLIGAIPNILAAILIGVLGYVLARIFGDVAKALSSSTDKLVKKTDLPEGFSPSGLLGQVVFLFIFVPILISSLEVLQIESISEPATSMLEQLLGAVPQILAAAVILGVAFIAGRFVTNFLGNFLRDLGVDTLPEKIGLSEVFSKTTLSKTCSWLVFLFIMLAAVVSASQKLGFTILSDLTSQLLVFAGNVLLGLVILGIGTWIANIAHKALSGTSAKGATADLARLAIMVLVFAMGLRAMGVAEDIVNLAFLLTLGAVAVAAALSFGLGGREAAGEQMSIWLKRLRGEDGENK